MMNDNDIMTILQTQKNLQDDDNVFRAYTQASFKVRSDAMRCNIREWKRIFSDKKYALAYLILFLIMSGIATGLYFWIASLL